MFNFFKKEEPVVSVFFKEKSKYSKEVLEIHHEFEIASDKLLKECKEILQKADNINTDKTKRLENLGFKQAKEVLEVKPLIQKAVLSKDQIDLINYYKINYPFNKFITEDQVKEICHKYNLVCGNVERFKGFVPEKNLLDIENFKLKEKESNFLICKGLRGTKDFVLENAKVYEYFDSDYFFIVKKGKEKYSYDDFAFQSNDGVEFYAKDRENIFGLKSLGHINFNIINNNLQICAPVKDMDITGLELTEGYKLEKKHIPDPVVLQPVNGGYLILTAWGDEASDPIVVNEINN